MLDSGFLQELIRMGKEESCADLPLILERFPEYASGNFTRQRPEYWYAVAVPLTVFEIEALIVTLTIADHDLPSFRSGSVSPVIWLYKILIQKTGQPCERLEDWVLAHTNNDYLPWGTSNHGAKSLQEFKEITKRRSDRKNANLKVDEALHVEATIRKGKEASEKLFGAIKRKDYKAIVALRLKGADVNTVGPDGCSALKQVQTIDDQSLLEAMTCQLTDDKRIV